MYRCEECGAVVGPRVRARFVVTKRRQRDYPYRPKVNRYVETYWQKGRIKRTVTYLDDPGGSGLETARARQVCPRCAEELGCMAR